MEVGFGLSRIGYQPMASSSAHALFCSAFLTVASSCLLTLLRPCGSGMGVISLAAVTTAREGMTPPVSLQSPFG